MRRTHARAKRGHVAVCHHSNQPEKNVTGVGAVRALGPVVFKSYNRAITSRLFLGFFRHQLVPRLSPGDVVVMDNLRVYHSLLVRRAARKANVRLLYLPPYSPQFNPIEKVWAWMKQRLRFRLCRVKKNFRYAIAGAWRALKNLDISAYISSCELPSQVN